MSKKIIFLFTQLLFLLFGCSILKTNIQKSSPIGQYNNYHVGGSEEMKISPDSTFIIEIRSPGRRIECKGNWKVISKNELLLNCKDTYVYQNSIDSSLLPPYNLIDEKIIFLNKNKIKHERIILKKKKRNK